MKITLTIKTSIKSPRMIEQTIYCDPSAEQLINFIKAALDSMNMLRTNVTAK